METWLPTFTNPPKPRTIQEFLNSLESEKLSEAQLPFEHSIVLSNMCKALAGAICEDRVSELDSEVALFMRSLRLLGVAVCREILDKGFLGHYPSPSTEPRG